MEADTPASRLNIWLLSPYDSGSHYAWARGYMAHSRHDITLLNMAGRFWKWRMQGGAIHLATLARRQLEQNKPPDAVLATDMVNLPAWLGLVRRELPSQTPILLYMHENQITYPWREGERRDLTYGMINWLSQLAADRICFNSHFHMESWFDELPRLLKHYPDYNHRSLVDVVRARSQVLPVGVECMPFVAQAQARGDASDSPLIVWNQRWEYDKRPDRFFALMDRLADAGAPYRLAVAGENFRMIPQEFDEARRRLGDHIVHWGYLEKRGDYVNLLSQSDLVISTADHEFFGISVLEAVAAGAHPLLPNRLSYPELIPDEYHTQCLYGDDEALFRMARGRLVHQRPASPGLREYVVDHYDWSVVAEHYDELLESMVGN